jgi:hypothetical protein
MEEMLDKYGAAARQRTSWKIAHEHTSAPAGDEGKVQLRR